MIADRHIFVVRQQRIVGSELLADVGRVVNADVEVGVIADQAGHVQPNLGLSDQLGLDIVAVAFVAKGVPEGARAARVCASGPRASQAFSTGCERSLRQSSSSRSRISGRSRTKSPIATPARRAPLADREDSERQVLDRKIAALGAFAPTRERRIVGGVGHGSFALGNPAHAWS